MYEENKNFTKSYLIQTMSIITWYSNIIYKLFIPFVYQIIFTTTCKIGINSPTIQSRKQRLRGCSRHLNLVNGDGVWIWIWILCLLYSKSSSLCLDFLLLQGTHWITWASKGRGTHTISQLLSTLTPCPALSLQSARQHSLPSLPGLPLKLPPRHMCQS